MALYRRVLGGTAANGLAVCFYIVLQLLTAPVLTHAWGAGGFGTWLMMVAIPTYIALSDLGFVAASTNDIAMSMGRGDADAARVSFHSAAAMVGGACGVILLVALACYTLVYGTGWRSWQGDAPVALPLLVLIAYSCLGLVTQLLLGAFQGGGQYALGTIVTHFLVLLEGLSVLAVAASGGQFIDCALTLLVARTIAVGLIAMLARRSLPWFTLGLADASMAHIRRLSTPALASLAIPVALALNLQGMVMAVGLALSAAAVATWATVRTVTRLAIQVSGTLNRAAMPELSAVWVKGDVDGIRRIVLLNIAVLAACLLPAALVVGAFGPRIVSLWTSGHVQATVSFTAVMSLTMVIHGIWFGLSNLLQASNSHAGIARPIALVNAVVVGAALLFGDELGLDGIAALLAVGETLCLVAVLKVAQRESLIPRAPFRSIATAAARAATAGRR